MTASTKEALAIQASHRPAPGAMPEVQGANPMPKV